MQSYIILLRGVNVGGNNKLPMKALKTVLENADFKSVNTYIQSGNIVLMTTANPEQTIANLIQLEFGFRPEVLAIPQVEYRLALANNPYADYEAKTIHGYFCKNVPKLNIERLTKLASKTESYQLIDKVFYLHAPEGIGRSKLVASIESCLGVSATGRNFNTLNKLAKMLP